MDGFWKNGKRKSLELTRVSPRKKRKNTEDEGVFDIRLIAGNDHIKLKLADQIQSPIMNRMTEKLRIEE